MEQDYLHYNVDDAPQRNLKFHNITSIFRGESCRGRLHWGKSGAKISTTDGTAVSSLGDDVMVCCFSAVLALHAFPPMSDSR